MCGAIWTRAETIGDGLFLANDTRLRFLDSSRAVEQTRPCYLVPTLNVNWRMRGEVM